jgi:hypothetical protein
MALETLKNLDLLIDNMYLCLTPLSVCVEIAAKSNSLKLQFTSGRCALQRVREKIKEENILRQQGCQTACFQTKSPNSGILWRALEWKNDFRTIWNILWPLEIFNGNLILFVVIWYIYLFWFVWTKKKSGNPVRQTNTLL